MECLVVMGADIAAWEHLFEVLEERRVDGHYVFVMAMDRAVLHHDDLAVLLDDGRLDLADLLVEEDADVFLAVENRLPGFARAVRTERVGLTGPPKGRLGFLIRLQERLVRPAWSKRGVLSDLVGRGKDLPEAIGSDRQSLLDVLHRRMHAVALLVLDAQNPSNTPCGHEARAGNPNHPIGQTVKNQAISSELANPGVGLAVEGCGGRAGRGVGWRGGLRDERGKSRAGQAFVPLPLAEQIESFRSLYFPHTRQIGTMWRPC